MQPQGSHLPPWLRLRCKAATSLSANAAHVRFSKIAPWEARLAGGGRKPQAKTVRNANFTSKARRKALRAAGQQECGANATAAADESAADESTADADLAELARQKAGAEVRADKAEARAAWAEVRAEQADDAVRRVFDGASAYTAPRITRSARPRP